MLGQRQDAPEGLRGLAVSLRAVLAVGACCGG